MRVQYWGLMFTLSDKQSKEAHEWLDNHEKECPMKYAGAIGGKTTWKFTGTSIGIVIVVECACGSKCDVSDYDDW